MFSITLSDLLYRRRQFLIAILGAALVFAMTLLLAGLTSGLRRGDRPDRRRVPGRRLGGQGRLVRAGRLAHADGRTSVVAAWPGLPGSRARRPVVVIPQTAVGERRAAAGQPGRGAGRLRARRSSR